MSGISLNSLSPGHNGGPLSPLYNSDFQEMTINPQFMVGPGLSQDSVSVYNTCSSCPPHSGKVHENIYQIDSFGCEDFEMTDNPYYEYDDTTPESKWCNDSESASLQYSDHYAKSTDQGGGFEFSDNTNYETSTHNSKNYTSDMSLSRTQSPRFQIVSERRGDVREKVNLVRS